MVKDLGNIFLFNYLIEYSSHGVDKGSPTIEYMFRLNLIWARGCFEL